MFAGKVAFVTGANSGIGAATAKAFSKEGAKVALVARGEEALKKLADEMRSEKGEVLELKCDVTKAAEVERAVSETVAKWGRIDVVFANAGINGVWAPIDELKPEEWEKTISTNLTGTYLTVHYTVPHMKKQGSGAIIIDASINGTRTFSNPGSSVQKAAYVASKAGQVGMMKALALELAKHKIRVNSICPGAIDTAINSKTEIRHKEESEERVEFPGKDTPVPLTGGKPGSPENCADLVCFLASSKASHITGTEVWIDGAESLFGR